MNAPMKSLLVAAATAGTLALSSMGASAAIVCTGNVCWHATERYDYPRSAGVIVRPDAWKWGPSERYVWREHEGRGYWNGDRWTDF